MSSEQSPASRGRTEREVWCELDALLAARGLTLTELSRRTGITMANLSILKNNKAKAIRMSTLAAVCAALDVEPGDLLTLRRPAGGESTSR